MPRIKEIYVLHHSHTDIGYTHAQPILWELESRFIDMAIDLCEETADWPEPSRLRWTCETTGPVLHWLKSASDRQIERFRKLVQAGQMGISGMLCNITPLYSAEQLARSLQPVRRLREILDAPIKTAINHDVNGLPWPLTQLLLDAGIEMVIMGINPHFGRAPLPRPKAYRWHGSDGRPILAFNGETYQQFDRKLRMAEGSIEAMAEGWKEYEKRLTDRGYPYDKLYITMTFYGWGDNNPPNPRNLRLVRQWNEEGREPQIRYILPETLLEYIQQQPENTIGDWRGDWTDWWNFGAGSSARELRLNRESRVRLHNAGMLRSSEPALRSPIDSWMDSAYWDLNMYDEHTWGAAKSVTHPHLDDVATQWQHKANYAYQARTASHLIQRDLLEAFSENPVHAMGSGEVLFVNPAPVARRVYARLPLDWLDGSWLHFPNKVQWIDPQPEHIFEKYTRLVGPIELPAYGWKSIPAKQLKAASENKELKSGKDFIESPFHRIEFDPATGRLLRLYDKRLDWEALPREAEWPFFGYACETLDPEKYDPNEETGEGEDVRFVETMSKGRKLLYEFNMMAGFDDVLLWRSDWPAFRQGTQPPFSCEVKRTPDSVSIVIRQEAPGVEDFERRITLFAHRDAIECSASFYKTKVETPEGIYFTFPLALPEGWKAHFDTAGLPLELDAEQIPLTARDYVTVGHWATVHNGDRGITLACPDAPLVQIGYFHFGKAQEAIPRKANPLLLGWFSNNYWNTNFRASQADYQKVRYEIRTHGAYDPKRSTEAGLDAMVPVLHHPVVDKKNPAQGRLVELDGEGVVLYQMKPAADGDGIVVLIANVDDKEQDALIGLPDGSIAQAWRVSTLEENREALPVKNGKVLVPMKKRSLTTIRLKK